MTKWQKDYLDVPADDYLTSEDYILSMGFPLDYKPPLFDLIGPHEQRYMNLMRLGRKPVTLISEWELKYWNDEIHTQGWIIEPFVFRSYFKNQTVNDYVVYLPGQQWRVLRLRKCYKTIERRPWIDADEARVGFLLGYTKQCIRAYLERKRLFDVGDYDGAKAPHLNYIKGNQSYAVENNI